MRRARLRWAHLLLGGALLMPYFLLSTVALQTAGAGDRPGLLGGSVVWQLAALALSLPLVTLTGLAFPLIRALESAAAEALCGLPAGALAPGTGRPAAARRRTAAWFTLHTGLGALISGATLAVPPLAAALLVVPFVPALRRAPMSTYAVLLEPTHLLSPVYGLAMLALLVAAARGAGTVLARCAPLLLGPTPADRLAAAEERAERLAVRNQLARELHDSVGHALSAVTLQAGAARKVLETDHTFVRDALTAIEEVTRDAVAELDTVLGALHEGAHDTTPPSRPATSAAGPPSATAGQRLTTGLESLVRRTRSAGLDVTCAPSEDLLPDDLPADVAHTAYRIVQEGLSNALRHAAAQPLRLWLASTHEELRITMENPFGTREDAAAGRRAGPPAGGGRGLHGIAERAALLGGVAEAGEEGGMWRLTARLPLSTADAADTRQKRDR